MAVTPHNIPGHPDPPPGFCHATAAEGKKVVHISGQVGTDESGQLAEGGLAGQTERALINVKKALEAAGASVDDMVRVRFYIKDWDPSMFEEFGRGAAAASSQVTFPPVAVTLLGVSSLFTPDMLIEIEAVAVVD
jgi:enamine deaminase RidA (YjgF/YER057c/UK114 family)